MLQEYFTDRKFVEQGELVAFDIERNELMLQKTALKQAFPYITYKVYNEFQVQEPEGLHDLHQQLINKRERFNLERQRAGG